MLHRILSTIAVAFICIAASAQGVCVIKGNIADGNNIKKVVLTRTDEFGKSVEVATAKVKKGKYTFKYELSKDEPVLQYAVTGFGDGKAVELFVEPGEVTVSTPSVAAIEESVVAGTPTNETYAEYKAVLAAGAGETAALLAALEARLQA